MISGKVPGGYGPDKRHVSDAVNTMEGVLLLARN
jgi:hypothetical protein